MSKILISGCGITFSGERPTWAKVLKIAGLDIVDVSGPAISNQLIVNQLLEKVYQDDFKHVVCQLTSFGKLDVEMNKKNKWLMEKDSLRNFTYKGYWPSSHSVEDLVKRNYRDYLYSPTLEQQDLIYKLLLLQQQCNNKDIKLHIIQGYALTWTVKLIDHLDFNKDFNIYDMYQQSTHYEKHDFSNQNTVPNKSFQIFLAKHICEKYLMIKNNKLEKFHE